MKQAFKGKSIRNPGTFISLQIETLYIHKLQAFLISHCL